jgi:putative membrane protein
MERRIKSVKSFLIGRLIDGAAVLVAALIVPGLHAPNGVVGSVVVAIVFAAINLVLRPVVMLLAFPILLVFFVPSFVLLNAVMLWICSRLSDSAGFGFRADGLIALILGASVVIVVRLIAKESVQAWVRRRQLEKERAQLEHLERVRTWMQGERDRFKRAAEERRTT